METKRRSDAWLGFQLVPALLLFATGCFTKPHPDIAKLTCQGDQQCPVGYACKVKGVPGGCCKDGDQTCGLTGDAAAADVFSVDLHPTTETGSDNSSGGGDSAGSGDASLVMDQAAGDAGGFGDTGSSGGAGGLGGATASGGAGGSGGATASGGAGGSGGSSTVARLDGSVPDTISALPDSQLVTVPDAPPADVPPDLPAPDAPGTCSADKDCPSQTPLCLGDRCAKCAGDSDCIGRTGPACAASGLCVACTTNQHCKGVAATCNTTSNQCVGCVSRNDCAGSCQTCTAGACTAVKSQDDPGVCAGTCDAAGACKSKQGQTCKAATDCVGGMPCADGLCCSTACTGSC